MKMESTLAKEHLMKICPKIMRDFRNIVHQKNKRLAISSCASIKDFIIKNLDPLSRITRAVISDKEIDHGWLVKFDGIDNFACDIPLFSISLSLFHNGYIITSLIAIPFRNEIYVAEYNNGILTFSFADNGLQKCSNTSKIEDAYIGANVIMDNLNLIDLRCNSLSYLYAATGRLDGCILELNKEEMAVAQYFLKEGGLKMSICNDTILIAANQIIYNDLIQKCQSNEHI